MEKALVSYFSASGVTAKAAKTLAEAAGAALYEIKPAEPYTPADLDWTNKRSRSSMEMNDKASRPALADRDAKIEDYNVVFLCFPIWWYVAPRSSTLSWRATISAARRSFCLPPLAAAAWAGRLPACRAVWQPIPGSLRDGCSMGG